MTTSNQNRNASSRGSVRLEAMDMPTAIGGKLIRMNPTPNPNGPHTDQVVRDMLDDHGLVVAYGNVAGAKQYLMEVVG